jgi:CheY-like chemotaxis protein
MKVKNILLIDDNEIDQYITMHILLKQKAAENIVVQSSTFDALIYMEGILRNSPGQIPEYIFLDVRIPEMDGFGFLDEFTKFPEAIIKYCSVVILTSSSDPKDIERAMKYPVVKKYFEKSLSVEMLNSLERPGGLAPLGPIVRSEADFLQVRRRGLRP